MNIPCPQCHRRISPGSLFCSHCGNHLPPVQLTFTKRPPWTKAILIVFGVLAAVSFLGYGALDDGSNSEGYKVTYDVVGTGTTSASVTYRNQGGGTEQREVKLPWTESFSASPGDYLYISAQNKNGSGSITTYISINGETRKTSNSSGGHVIASASQRCCN